MSITVTPGYDFTVHEVPRQETLLEQVNGMSITGIDVTALDSAVVPIMYGDVSQATNSLQTGDTVGTMWVSGIGDIFVQEQSGAVALSRINYGYETRRFWCEPDASFPAHIEPGVNMWTQPAVGVGEDTFRDQAGTHSSGSSVLAPADGGSYDDNQDGWMVGVLVDETSASGHQRVCIRGLAVYTDRTHTDADTWSKLRDYQNGYRISRPHDSIPVEHQLKAYWHSADIGAERWFGFTPLPGPGASKVTDASLGDHQWKKEHIMYVFGSEQRSNQIN
jgi:hypothetical protein